jgi:DNA-binding XRE family transcriptional regulator
MRIHPQIITKNKYPEFVVLPYKEYEIIIEALEDQIDIKAIDEFHSGNGETFSLELVQKLANGENPIKLFRELRKISQTDFAKKAGISRQYLNQLENGTRKGSAKILKKIANLLDIEIDLLID